MRPPVVVGIIVLGAVLLVASFTFGRFTARRAQEQATGRAEQNAAAAAWKSNRLLSAGADQNDHVLVANVASVSFAELWDVMRAGTPAKRIEWAHQIEQLPPGTRRNAALKSFYKIWAELDPISAVRALGEIQDKRVQSRAFYAAADAAADSALPIFAELQSRLSYPTNSFSGRAMLARWAAADPPGVAKFLEAHPQTSAGFFMDTTYNWAASDPESAAEWFTKLKLPAFNDPRYPRAEDRRRLEAARGLLQAWLDKDSRAAVAFVATHVSDPDMKTALAEFTGDLFARSHEQATTLINSLPDENAQRAALTEIMKHIGGRVITLKEGGDEEEPEEADIQSKDVPAWLVKLPASLWIDQIGEVLDSWDETNPSEAESWLHSLPPDARAKAISDYSATASAGQAPRVFEFIRLIADATVRRGALQKFVANLGDKAEARQKVAELSITDQQKQVLLRLVSEGQ